MYNLLAKCVEKIVANIKCPENEDIPVRIENIIAYLKLLATIGNNDITAKKVVIILGLDSKTKKACLKAILLSIF